MHRFTHFCTFKHVHKEILTFFYRISMCTNDDPLRHLPSMTSAAGAAGYATKCALVRAGGETADGHPLGQSICRDMCICYCIVQQIPFGPSLTWFPWYTSTHTTPLSLKHEQFVRILGCSFPCCSFCKNKCSFDRYTLHSAPRARRSAASGNPPFFWGGNRFRNI